MHVILEPVNKDHLQVNDMFAPKPAKLYRHIYIYIYVCVYIHRHICTSHSPRNHKMAAPDVRNKGTTTKTHGYKRYVGSGVEPKGNTMEATSKPKEISQGVVEPALRIFF